MEDKSIILPFSEMKQSALLGHLLGNSKFFKQAHGRIKDNWFISEKHSKIYKLLLSYYKTYGTHPTPYELRAYREFLVLDPKERETLYAHISACIANTSQFRLNALSEDLTGWLHSVILLDALRTAETQFNKQNIRDCHAGLMQAIQEVNHTKFNNEEEVDFLAFNDYLIKAENEREGALTTGLSILDYCMLEGSTTGGLLPGDSTIFMGSSNSGKSTALITTIVHNIKRNKDVFYMTHEDKKETIRLKLLSNYLECSINELFEITKSQEGQNKLKTASEHIKQHLKYVPYNKSGKMFVEYVIPIIRQNQEDWMASHDSKGFDLVVSDYPFVLTTELAYRGTLQRRNIDDIICNHYVQLGLEYNFHVLMAIQTNREGSKVNRGDSIRRLLGMEDVRESWGPMTQVSNVITLNRSPDDEKRQILTFGLAKCRSAAKNIAVCAKTKFVNSITHSNTLGGFAYTGTKTPEEQVEQLLLQFNGQKIPDTNAHDYGL